MTRLLLLTPSLYCLVFLTIPFVTLAQEPVNVITSGNPIITHIRCADPSAEVWEDGQVWIYSSHDPDNAVDYSTMADYHAFSSYDLVNWTDHGVILRGEDVSWINSSKKWMFAPDAAFKNGTYYLFFPTMSYDWKWRVGVATSDTPEGPFTDCGHYIDGTDQIDPTCFVDDDGQAYLMWGGGDETPKIARLKENMTELAEEPRLIDYGFDNFGEGGYMHKKDSIYYFSYTCNTCYPYQSYYSTANNPYGPFEYQGAIKKAPPGAQDHHSLIEYHGQWYYFYHTGNYGPDGSIYRRNICIDSMLYNPDGTIREIVGTTTGVTMDEIGGREGNLIPGRFEAENFYKVSGMETIMDGTDSLVINIQSGDWIEYILDVLGSEKYYTEVGIKNAVPGSRIFLYLDDKVFDTLYIDATDSKIMDSLSLKKGKHTLKLEFSYTDEKTELLKLDFFELSGKYEYFSIESSAGEGGSISPAGREYYRSGDSAVYTISEEQNYSLASLFIDGIDQGNTATYTFRNLSGNHTIEAEFVKCNILGFFPYYIVNGLDKKDEYTVSVSEQDSLKLGIEVEESCSFAWTGPGAYVSSDQEIFIDSITTDHAGTFSVTIINTQGCTYTQDFDVQVDYAVLDVFRAEDCLWQSGTQYFDCKDLGGGYYMGKIDDMDWCFFDIHVPETGIYNLTTRVATGSKGGFIDITIADSLIATIEIDSSQSEHGEDWYTSAPVEAGFQAGNQILKFTFRGNDGELFNFNWWDMEFSRSFPSDTTAAKDRISTSDLYITSDFIQYHLIENSEVEIRLYSISGRLIDYMLPAKEQRAGKHILEWNIQGQPEMHDRVYLVYFRNGNTIDVRKVRVSK